MMNCKFAVQSRDKRSVAWLGVALVAWCAARPAPAQVTLTETFDVGTGSRFNLFVDNFIVKPRPATLDNPADDALVDDAFGGEHPLVENGNIVTNRFGFTTTQNAGGAGAGEFGGEFNWFDLGGVADTNLGGALSPSQMPIIKGKMIIRDVGSENDQYASLSYYNLPATPAASDFGRGLILAGIGVTGGPRFTVTINGARSGPINIPYDEVVDIDLTLKYDAGTETAWFEGMVGQIPVSQLTFSRTLPATTLMNAFGIGQGFERVPENAWRRSVVFYDDVSYSAISDGGIDNPNPVRIDPPSNEFAPGDFNENTFVDNDDLLLWKGGFGMAMDAEVDDGDADDDGDVNGNDLLLWQQNVTPIPIISVVPEPNSAALCLMAAGLGWRRTRRRAGARRSI